MKRSSPLGALGQWFQDSLPIWYDPCYRPPLQSARRLGVDPRRADWVAWYLTQAEKMSTSELRQPGRISYRSLARVHQGDLLEELGEPESLATHLGAPVEAASAVELAHTLRMACGGTLEAARKALRSRGPALNLLGGWVEAGPRGGIGLAQLNDVATAIAALRSEGFRGQVVVLQLGEAPITGLRACLEGVPKVWTARVSDKAPSGSAEQWLEALDQTLDEMPRAALTIVVCGSEALASGVGPDLDLAALRERDLKVEQALASRSRLYLPGGGGGRDAWRALAGTAVTVGLGRNAVIDADFNPLRARFAAIGHGLREEQLAHDDLSYGIAEELGHGRSGDRMLGYYTAEGIEHALYEYGFLDHLQRLGFRRFEVLVDALPMGDRMRLIGESEGERHMLVESTLSAETIDGEPYLFVHWLTLRNPHGQFTHRRPRLPGQDAPGLGMALEAGEVLRRMARRLGMAGVAMQPSWFHVAYTARYEFSFQTLERQARFVALIRDTRALPLDTTTRALAEGRILLNDAPYAWEADRMTTAHRHDPKALRAAAQTYRFTVKPAPEPGSP